MLYICSTGKCKGCSTKEAIDSFFRKANAGCSTKETNDSLFLRLLSEKQNTIYVYFQFYNTKLS